MSINRMRGFPQNIIGQPAVKIDGGIRVGVGPEAAANTFKLFLCLAVVPVYGVASGAFLT
nr:hypothetical protein [Paraburkholderia panacisoli]